MKRAGAWATGMHSAWARPGSASAISPQSQASVCAGVTIVRSLSPGRRLACAVPASLTPHPLATQQQILGLVDLGREIGRAALVGMQLLHQALVGVVHLVLRGARLQAEDTIGLVAAHGRRRRAARRLGLARRLARAP